ncbi:hypothetical protein K431DRAFT_79012 [Polychaeton citri CBS 116435]|uniref:Ankyrin n=1 Tax=Polychaeton citri CBS 116435 TaxID=1314669 RepID=A0A9P4USY3_9PEZI|nr:hypothetical protein K431DRAFT_79012 [Polychaeton citri CBS 116435]
MASGMPGPTTSSRDAHQQVGHPNRRLIQVERRHGDAHDTGRGRPPKELDKRHMRILLRLFLRTGISFEKLVKLFKAVDGGVTKNTLRRMLEEVLGVDQDTDLVLKDMRPRPHTNAKLDSGQWKAAKINNTRNASSMSPEDHGSIAQRLSPLGPTSPESFEFGDFIIFDQDKYDSPSGPVWTQNNDSTPAGKGAAMTTFRTGTGLASELLPLDPKNLPTSFHEGVPEDFTNVERAAVEHVERACTAGARSTMMTAVTRDSLSFTRRSTLSEYAPYRKETNEHLITRKMSELNLQQGDATVASLSYADQLLSLIRVCSTDDNAVVKFQWFLSRLNHEERKQVINQGDGQGVTLLHLAVAYGYVRFCSLLIDQWGANVKAKTARETSVYRFAKYAEKEAKSDIPLYAKIVMCRQFVRHGCAPPIPNFQKRSAQHRNIIANSAGQRQKRTATTAFQRENAAEYRQKLYTNVRNAGNAVPSLATTQPSGVAQHSNTAPVHTFSYASNATGSISSAQYREPLSNRPIFHYCAPGQRTDSPVPFNQSQHDLIYQGTTVQPWHMDDAGGTTLPYAQAPTRSTAAPPSDLPSEYELHIDQAADMSSDQGATNSQTSHNFLDVAGGASNPHNRDSGYCPSFEQQRSRHPSPSPLASSTPPALETPTTQPGMQRNQYNQFGQAPVHNGLSSPSQRRFTKKAVQLECPVCHLRVSATLTLSNDPSDEERQYQCLDGCGPYWVKKSTLLANGGNIGG